MLQCHREGAVAVFTLDRPKARNALSRQLCDELGRALKQASEDESVSAVVLASSHPSVFIAGGDLGELAALPMTLEGADKVLELGSLTLAVEACTVPVVAAVSGAALGGGAEVTVACDLVVMGPTARIAFVHARMGLVPAWGGATRLEERVGALRAMELLLTARAIDAEEAFAIGLCNRRADNALIEALRLATAIAAHTRVAIAQLKRSIVSAREARRGDSLNREASAFRSAWGSAAHHAAFDALKAKRRGVGSPAPTDDTSAGSLTDA